MTTENIVINIREDGSRTVVVNITAIANASANASRATNSLRQALGGLSVAYLTKQFFEFADALTLIESRLRLATKSSQEFNKATEDIYRISQANNVGLRETAKLYTKLAEPVRLMGGTMKEVGGVVEAFASALRISGATTAEANAATLQFSQAMNKGKLDGDEFRTMAEVAPRVMRAFADGMDKPIGQLKSMSTQGKLTSDVLANALLKELKNLKEEAKTVGDTVGGAMSDLSNDTLIAVGAFDKMTGTSRMTADAISGISLVVFELGQVFKNELKDGAADTNNEFEAMTVVIRTVGTLIEWMMVLAARAVFNIKSLGENLGGFAAQVHAAATGDWAAIGRIQGELAAKNEQGFKELERYQTRILGITDRALAAREKLRNGAPETDYDFKALQGQAVSEDKLIATRMRLAGITKSYYSDLNNLQSAYESGKIETKEYVGLVSELAKKTWEASAAGKAAAENMKPRAGSDDRMKTMRNELAAQQALFGQEETLFNDRTQALEFYNSKMGMSDAEYYEGKENARKEFLAAITSSFTREKEIIESFKPKNENEEADKKGRLDRLTRDQADYFSSVEKMRRQDAMSVLATNKQVADSDTDRQNAFMEGEYETLTALKKSNDIRVRSASAISKETEAILEQAIEKQKLQNIAPGAQDGDIAQGKKNVEFLEKMLGIRRLITGELEKQEKLKAKDRADLKLIDDWKNIGKDIADSLKSSFGQVGESVGGVFNSFAQGMANQLEMAYRLNKEIKGMDLDDPERYRLIQEAQEKSAQAQIKSYGDMAGAAKGFFKENTTGYKVLEATEKAFRLFQLAMTAATMAKKLMAEKAGTAASVGNAGKEATSWGVTAVVKAIAAAPPPYSFVLGAATAAAIVGLGVKLNSGISAGGVGAAKMQETQGTGSILGDKSAKSQSVANSFERLEKSAGELVPINMGMWSSLRNIETSMKGLNNAIARTPGVANGTNLGIKTGQVNPYGSATDSVSSFMTKVTNTLFLGFGDKISKFINNLWGKTTATIVDSGIQFGGNLRDLQSGKGFDQYASVDTTKSSVFGLVKKTTNSTTTASLGDDLTKELGNIFGNMEDVLTEAGSSLGIKAEDIKKTLDGLTIDKTSLSLKGLSGDALADAISSVVSKGLDQMAEAVFPELDKFRQVGEGYAETIIRLASNYAIIDAELGKLGGTFGMVGTKSLEAREAFLEMVGGTDELSSKVGKFSKEFLTEAEQLAPVSAYVATEMARLGMAGVTTRDQFKAAVVGLMESGAIATAAGMDTFTGLLNVAEAFAQVTPAIKATGDSAYNTASILDEKNELQKKYDELTMTGEALEKKRADAVHSTNKELYLSVVAATKAKEALDKLNETNKSWQDKIDAQIKSLLPLNKQRELEKEGMDASTIKLVDRYNALMDEATALDINKQKYRNMNEVLTASLNLAESAAEAAMDAVTAAVSKQKELAQTQYDDKIKDLDLREKKLRKDYDTAVNAIKTLKDATKTQYDDAIKALGKEKDAATKSYKIAVDGLKATEKEALQLYKNAVKALGTEKDAAIKSYQESIQAMTDLIKAASDKVNGLERLVSTLTSTLDSMRAPGTEGAYRGIAQAQIASALAQAKAGGALPSEEDIAPALKTAAMASQDLFSKFSDYEFDFYRTATDIRDLNDIASGQLLQATTELSVLEATKEQMTVQHEALLLKLDEQREALDVANELRTAAFDAQLEAMTTAQEKLMEGFDARREGLDSNYESATANFESQLNHLATQLEISLGGIDAERLAAKELLQAELDRLQGILDLAQKQYDTQLGIHKAVLPLEDAIKNLDGALKVVQTTQTAVTNPSPAAIGQAEKFAREILNQITSAGGYDLVQSQNETLIATFGPSLQQIADANSLYIRVLGRSAEGNSAAALAAQMKNGLTTSDAITMLQGSKEYEARQISVDLQKQVNRLVNAVLNNGINADSLFVNGSHASGLGSVPWDGYIAQLHKGEMVVPRGPADIMRAVSSSPQNSESDENSGALLQQFIEYRKDRRVADAAIATNTKQTKDLMERIEKLGLYTREQEEV